MNSIFNECITKANVSKKGSALLSNLCKWLTVNNVFDYNCATSLEDEFNIEFFFNSSYYQVVIDENDNVNINYKKFNEKKSNFICTDFVNFFDDLENI